MKTGMYNLSECLRWAGHTVDVESELPRSVSDTARGVVSQIFSYPTMPPDAQHMLTSHIDALRQAPVSLCRRPSEVCRFGPSPSAGTTVC